VQVEFSRQERYRLTKIDRKPRVLRAIWGHENALSAAQRRLKVPVKSDPRSGNASPYCTLHEASIQTSAAFRENRQPSKLQNYLKTLRAEFTAAAPSYSTSPPSPPFLSVFSLTVANHIWCNDFTALCALHGVKGVTITITITTTVTVPLR
jgi:hypothetical protein